MRARMLLLVVAILLMFGFVALNLPEFLRTAPISFGFFVTEASLGLVMLGILSVGLVAFLLTGAMYRTQTLIESRNHLKEVQHHRDLADKAEASRFTELRTYLDQQLRELRQRDAIAATELEKSMVNSQRELRNQLDAMNRLLTARLSEIENRLDARLAGIRAEPPVLTQRVREKA